MSYLYSGVLPYNIINGELCLLLGKEKDGEWSDWGGGPEFRDINQNGEYDHRKTAAREAWEESRGMLGTEEEIYSWLNEKTAFSKDNQARIYPVLYPYDPNFRYYFHRNSCYAFHPDCKLPECHLEKTEAIWTRYEYAFQLPLRSHFYNQLILFGKLF